MAGRKRKGNDDAFALVIWVIIGIPLMVIAFLKWLFSVIDNQIRQNNSSLDHFDLKEVDQMDGFAFEHYVSELLKKNGYKQVFVTTGSGDFGVDITAYKDGRKYAFQCKNYQSKLGVAPIQEVYSGAPKYNATVCVVVTNSYFTPHAQDLAKTLNVLLWDRTILAQLIQAANTSSY